MLLALGLKRETISLEKPQLVSFVGFKTTVFVCACCLVVVFNDLYVNFGSIFDYQHCVDWFFSLLY